jgi:hypothetical protein
MVVRDCIKTKKLLIFFVNKHMTIKSDHKQTTQGTFHHLLETVSKS